MPEAMPELARFEEHINVSGDVETLHWMWVLGPHGAISTWFVDTKAVLGYSVCNGVAVHSPRPRVGSDHHDGCRFLESDCWYTAGSMLYLKPVIHAYDKGLMAVVWTWLGAHYQALVAELGDTAHPGP